MASTTKSGGESKRGFASMDEDKQREIASKGGKAAHEKGTAHEFDSEEAREAGRKGGEASHGGKSKSSSGQSTSSSRGGSSGQHAKAGSQSHKKD
jgi:general stress protein YciG